MSPDDLKPVLADHAAWLHGKGGRRADLRGADLQDANLRNANLQSAFLQGAVLHGAWLQGAVLHGAWLQGADLQCADLRGADLQGAVLQGAFLQGADLRCADLQGAFLQGADLQGAVLQSADFQGAKIADGITVVASPARRATRADGYEFFLWPTDAGWRVRAGCRFFTMDEAWRHWRLDRANTLRNVESQDILTMFDLHIQRAGDPA